MIIQPLGELGAVVRTGSVSSERSKERVSREGAGCGPLIIVLIAGKEEQLVLDYRSAHRKPGIAASEKWIRCLRHTLQVGIGRHIVIAEKEESSAVELVGAG